MTTKYQRPSGAYAGSGSLLNREKYQTDASSQPKVAISSSKIDGDFNYIVDVLNVIDEASGSRASIAERLSVVLNADGTLKASVAAVLDEWVGHVVSNLSRVDGVTVAFDGNHSGVYMPGRRVRLMVGGVPVFGSVVSCSVAANVTTLVLADLVDATGASTTLASTPTAVAYSPLTTGGTGNAPMRFSALAAGGVSVSGVVPLVRLKDTSGGGKEFGLRSNGGLLEMLENTGTESSPTWMLRGSVSGAGFSLVDGQVTTAKLADSAVTYAKIQSVTSGMLLGRSTAGSGAVEELSLGTGLSLSSGVLSISGGATFPASVTNAYNFGGMSQSPSATNVTLVANKLYGTPFYAGTAATYTKIGFSVVTAAAGKTVRVGVYKMGATVDAQCTLVADAGTVSVGTTGDKEVVASAALTPGMYYLVMLCDGTPVVKGTGGTTNNAIDALFMANTPGIGNGVNLDAMVSQTYGALPSAATFAVVGNSSYTPFMWVRR